MKTLCMGWFIIPWQMAQKRKVSHTETAWISSQSNQSVTILHAQIKDSVPIDLNSPHKGKSQFCL